MTTSQPRTAADSGAFGLGHRALLCGDISANAEQVREVKHRSARVHSV